MANRFAALIEQYDESIAALERRVEQRRQELAQVKNPHADILRALHSLEDMLGDARMAKAMMEAYQD